FSAILSTADSCLMASSGNVVSDLLEKGFGVKINEKNHLRISQLATLLIGIAALIIASQMQSVLNLMLYSYAFMVSGLFVPVIGGLYWKKSSATGAFLAMLLGGITTVILSIFSQFEIISRLPLNLDANIFGISVAAMVLVLFSYLFPDKTVVTRKDKEVKKVEPKFT
ncbi:MAG: sodium:solute symporter family transporter, partial [Cyclobacteriaceae bacterium]